MKKKLLNILLVITILAPFLAAPHMVVRADVNSDFTNPPAEYKTRPLWFWNNSITTTGINDIMQNSKDSSGYSGFAILPFTGQMSPSYLSPDYFSRYGDALSKAAALGMKMSLYDEYGFPSGSAGGQMASQYPNDLTKRLDMLAEDVTGSTGYTKTVPAGTLMGCVAMNNSTKQRTDITGYVSGGVLNWSVPSGSYKIMIFTCVTESNLCDYLEPNSVNKFIQLTHQNYYNHFSSYFGSTITTAFYDEPFFGYVQGYRVWTPAFNIKYQTKYGSSPVIYYPALWYDIGPDTAVARNALFGFRAELYSTGFPKSLNEWCNAHGIQLTGHVAPEEAHNASGTIGDLMKAFKYQDIPGIDEIYYYGFNSRDVKIVSSASFNYDRPLTMSETYGAMGEGMGINTLYKEAMDQYAKGINLLVPHAVWYDTGSVQYPPELSYRSSAYGPALPAFNNYMGRLNRLLQEGRHVADIAMLYPIASMHAGYYFDNPGDPLDGGILLPWNNYMEIGETLSLSVRRDFTYLHPETLDDKCTVNGPLLNLNNTNNYEQYKVLIIPGCPVINWSNLQKIRDFYNQGGKVIAIAQLPQQSAEPGHDSDVTSTIQSMFTLGYPRFTASTTWAGSGYEPSLAGDGDMSSRWNAAGETTGGQWLEIDFGSNKEFNKTIIKEAFDRTTSYNIQYWNGSTWTTCSSGTTLGSAKTDNFSAVTGSKIRLNIVSATECVSFYEFEVYHDNGPNLAKCTLFLCNSNGNGGKAYFIPGLGSSALKQTLDDALAIPDVKFENDLSLTGGNLSYIHKVKDGMGVYFFANSSDNSVDTYVRLKGNFTPAVWNPHDGTFSTPEYSHVTDSGQDVTRVRLVLLPVKSLFITMTDSGGTPTPTPTPGGPTATPIPTPTPTATPTPTSASGSTNVALTSNGATASASSTYNSSYPASAMINGDRKGVNWANGGGWNDNTSSSYPDWAEVDFSGSKTINEIDVFTLQDNYSSPSDPTTGMTFSLYGITAFDVQYWDGSAWITVTNGSVAGNNEVWRQFLFTPVTTNKIRVVVNNALTFYSRIVEIEAWTAGGTPTPTPTAIPGGTSIIIDDDDSGAVFTGSWTRATDKTGQQYNASYRYAAMGDGSMYAMFTPNIGTAGNYKVYAWWTDHPDYRASNTPYIIYYNGGNQTVTCDQRTNGGMWNLLGTWNLAAGTSGYVKITNNADNYVIADAMKFEPVGKPDTNTWRNRNINPDTSG